MLVKRFVKSGGAERYAVEVTRAMAQRGHHIDLYARQADETLLEGLNLIGIDDRMKFSSVLSSVSFARDAAQKIRGESYDVVHSHERAYCQDLLTVHTFSYRGAMANYPWWKKVDRIYLSPRSALYLWLEGRQMKTPRLAAVSSAVRREIGRSYGRTEGVSVISPGVDIGLFHPQRIARHRKKQREREKISGDDLVLLFVGSEFRRKGLDFLIPAVTQGMRLLVVGKGERGAHYRELAQRSGASERIRFVGHVEDVFGYYAAADALILPSLSEAFGMCILEAMACGLPVVASGRTGAAPLVENGVDGFVFQHFSELPGILEALRGPGRRREMGSRARQKAERHTWVHTTDAYEKLFHVIAEEKRKGRR